MAPEARYEQREAVELAFIAALQQLPGRQRDVLGFSAHEAAAALGTTATTSSRPRSAAETCAQQVGYWAAEALKPNSTTTYGDYQKMGLTGSYYQLVVDITEEAKQLRKTATHEQTLAFIAEEAKRRCARTVSTCTTAARYNGFPSC